MEQPHNRFRSRIPDLHVLLLPIATVTTLLAANPHEGIGIVDLRAPMTAALCVAALAWFLSGRFIAERLLRSLVSTMAAMLPLISGYLFSWLRASGLPTGPRAALEIALVVLAGAVGLAILRKVSDREQANRFLNLFAILVLVIAVPSLLRATGRPDVHLEEQTTLPDTAGLYRPDIYLIVLDAYSGVHSLSSVYGFDNTPFLEALRQRGFAVPDTARSNYVKTFLSIGSMLNRAYYERLTPPATDFPARDAYNGRMERNRTVVDLQRLGYRFHYVGSSYPPLSSNRLADEQYALKPAGGFQRLYFQSTLLRPLYELCLHLGICEQPELPFMPETADDTERRIAYLLSRIDEPGPKFVYAHWLLPHGPYRFDEACNPVPSRWTIGTEMVEQDSTARRLYIGQLECTNKLLLRVVDAIRLQGRSDNVVILQSDHGHGRFPGEMPTVFARSSKDQIAERFDVFAAYAGPGNLAGSLALATTPVNVMRTLFREVWGVSEPPLDDRHFWSEGEQPLKLIELTSSQIALPDDIPPPSR